MDIEGLARTVSGWWRTSGSTKALGPDTADAIAAARLGQVATLIAPNDHQLAPGDDRRVDAGPVPFEPIEPDQLNEAARRLRASQKTALLLGGRALRRHGLDAAVRVKRAIGCDLFAPTLPGYMDHGSGLPLVERVPYFPEQATARLSRYEVILLAGAPEPVTFFGYPGVRSRILSEEQEKIILCTDRQDVVQALEYLAEDLGTSGRRTTDDNLLSRPSRPSLPSGGLTSEKACLVLAALQPENAVIIDEGITTRFAYLPLSAGLPPHSILTVTGGSIGYGIPCATGAAIASPNRPVIDLQADGSALYTVQALWTQAREGLNVTTLICSNRSYRILQMELHRAGIDSYGPNTGKLTDLASPPIDWVKVSHGFGVPAATVSNAEDLAKELGKALTEPGPHLIEMLLP
jgi:acetolactate synthase-1/2/3 large subunit